VVVGDVVRVVLLFYLMPLWSVLLARWLLNEPCTPQAWVRVVLALAGALIVMGPQAQGEWAWLPLPRSLADALAVLGGMSFALNNVLLRREAEQPQASRALAMFVGGVLVAGVLAGALAATGKLALPPPSLAGGTVGWGLALMALVFLASNLALQYGAARLPAAVTSVVMLTEVLFATVSAVWLGSGSLTPSVWVGGAFILAAAALSAFERPRGGPSH
jgi:drug/metabolite transporter (DMT)-like permease